MQMANDIVFYQAAVPSDLPTLPISIRVGMQQELCAECGAEVWVHDRGFYCALNSVMDAGGDPPRR
jgi:hypothetical protein